MSFKPSSVFYEGYTAKGYIAAVPRLFDELRFTYRPMQAIERAKFVDSIEKLGDRYTDVAMGITAGRLVDWDLKDNQGKSYPVSKESLLLLHPALWLKLNNILMGYVASDADPLWETNETEQFDAEKLEAELSGRPQSIVSEETHLKNS